MAGETGFGPPEDDVKGFGPPEDTTPPAPAGPKSLLDRYEAAVEPFTRIEKPDKNAPAGKEALKAVGNIGAGGLGMILHPINTLEGMGGLITAPAEMVAGKPFKETIPGQMLQSFRENPYGTIEAGIGGAAVGKAIPLESPASTRTTVPRVLRPLIEKTQEAQKAATEATDVYRNALKQKTGEIAAEQTAKTKDAVKNFYEKSRTEPKTSLESGRPRTAEELQSHKAALTRGVEKIDPEVRTNLEDTATHVNIKAGQMYDDLRDSIGKEQAPSYQSVAPDGSPVGEPVSALKHIYDRASAKITDWSNDPILIKNLAERLKNPDKPETWMDLQELRTKVGAELRKGTLPADQYHAYKGMMEDIDGAMQKIADRTGKGKEQAAARNYYRQYAETFLDKGSPIRKAMETSDPKSRLSYLQDRMRVNDEDIDAAQAIAKHNPALAQKINTVRGYQSEADSISSPKIPAYKEAPQFKKPTFEGTPEELAKQKTPPPAAAGKTVIDQSDIEAAKKGKLLDDAESVRTKGWWGATVLSLYALRGVLHGDFSGAMAVPFDIGGTMAVTHGISQLMLRPSVVKFFSKATAKDIAAIPPELRGDLPKLVHAAQKQGIPVSAALAAIGGGTQQKPVAAALQTQ